jgi:SnoaL-like polyketide cyclase
MDRHAPDVVEAENRHDGEATIATFDHPRYEIIATGEIFDGASEVQSFYDENYGAFPDFSVTIEHTHHAEESVVAEGTITGTHLGTYRGLPPTGRYVRWPYAPYSSSSRIAYSANASTSTSARCCASSASHGTRTASAARLR